jgi:hypothetical protein
MSVSWILGLLSLAGALQVTPPSGAPQADNAQTNLAGFYACEGTTPDGEPYQGTVQIVRHGDTYRLYWTLQQERYFGLGIVSGEVLAVTQFGSLPGIVAYRIEQVDGGPRLVGHWTVAQANGRVFTETLTRRTHDAMPPPPHPLPLLKGPVTIA